MYRRRHNLFIVVDSKISRQMVFLAFFCSVGLSFGFIFLSTRARFGYIIQESPIFFGAATLLLI